MVFVVGRVRLLLFAYLALGFALAVFALVFFTMATSVAQRAVIALILKVDGGPVLYGLRAAWSFVTSTGRVVRRPSGYHYWSDQRTQVDLQFVNRLIRVRHGTRSLLFLG